MKLFLLKNESRFACPVFRFNKPGRLERSSGAFYLYSCGFNVFHIPAWSVSKNRWNQIAVLVNILCVANSTQWNNFALLKKKRASSPQHAVLWWDVVIEFLDGRSFRVISNSHFCVLKSFSFCISQKGILSISSWFYYFF